jgi:hypothetical protein
MKAIRPGPAVAAILRKSLIPILLVLAMQSAAPADLLERLGLRKRAARSLRLSEEQLTAGLKEALAKGVERSVSALGQVNGFLDDSAVRIPVPESLQWAEKAVRAAGQDKLADQFVLTMNRAAETAVAEAGGVLADAVRQMTIADAQRILSSTETAATEYFERTSRTNLQARMLPIIQRATEQTGVTAHYKRLLDRAGLGGLSGLGALTRSLLGPDDIDIDHYVTRKAIDGLFVKIAEEERRIRSDPAARTTELLQKVFGAAAGG